MRQQDRIRRRTKTCTVSDSSLQTSDKYVDTEASRQRMVQQWSLLNRTYDSSRFIRWRQRFLFLDHQELSVDHQDLAYVRIHLNRRDPSNRRHHSCGAEAVDEARIVHDLPKQQLHVSTGELPQFRDYKKPPTGALDTELSANVVGVCMRTDHPPSSTPLPNCTAE